LKVPEEKAAKVATKIEKELFSFFRDTDAKYKNKYRSLMFNLKDPKNNVSMFSTFPCSSPSLPLFPSPHSLMPYKAHTTPELLPGYNFNKIFLLLIYEFCVVVNILPLFT
jgi:hypothetical protein